MNRRAFLAGTAGCMVAIAGCTQGGGSEDGTTTEPNGETTTTPTETVGIPRTRTAETAETAGMVPGICADSVRFDSLSQAAREEFETALTEGRLVRDGFDEFRIVEEIDSVDDEIGGETCVRFRGRYYYAVFGPIGGGSTRNGETTDYTLSVERAERSTSLTERPIGTKDFETTMGADAGETAAVE